MILVLDICTGLAVGAFIAYAVLSRNYAYFSLALLIFVLSVSYFLATQF